MENTKNLLERNRIVKKFVIAIEETVCQEFDVEAENAEQAIELAENKYRSGEFVLEPGECQYAQMAVVNPEERTTEWIEI